MNRLRPSGVPSEDRLPEIDGAALEACRCLPEPLLQALQRGGFLRMAVPRRYGGDACDLPTILQRLWELARLDASTAWNVMIWAQGQIVLPLLPRATYERILADGPDVRVAATTRGSGTAHVDGEGYRLTGCWSFASGIGHSRWVLLHCNLQDGEDSRVVGALVSCEEVEIEDVWHVLGLRATGSNVVRARNVRLARGDLYAIDRPACATATAHSRLPIRASFSLHQAAVALGTAEGAVGDLVAQLAGSREHGGGDADREALLRLELGAFRSDLDGAKAALLACADAAWKLATRSRPVDERTSTAMWATGARSVRVATEIVLGCFRMAGAAGLFDGHPLQRRLRDAVTIGQHGNVAPCRVAALGASVMAGSARGGP